MAEQSLAEAQKLAKEREDRMMGRTTTGSADYKDSELFWTRARPSAYVEYNVMTADDIKHYTDGQSVDELAHRYPGSAESHIVLHRKLDTLINQMNELLQRIDPGYSGLPSDTGGG